MKHRITFLIGASGVGKTAVARRLEAARLESFEVCYFDRIGVPDVSIMIRDHGSGEEWQRAKTHEWVATISKQYLPANDVLLEGQTRPSFIEEACRAHNVRCYDIFLLDCADEARRARLAERGQADLATERMTNWARYLRHECRRRSHQIVDTTNMTIVEVVRSVADLVRRDRQLREHRT